MPRPRKHDLGGPIRVDKRITSFLSDPLHEAARRLAAIHNKSEADWVRHLVEREVANAVMRDILDVRQEVLCHIKSQLKQIVHDVPGGMRKRPR